MVDTTTTQSEIKTLRLWISNQPDDAGRDCTTDYLRAAGMDRLETMQLREDQIGQWHRHILPMLHQTIRDLGHGDGCEDLDATDPPDLVAYIEDEHGDREAMLNV